MMPVWLKSLTVVSTSALIWGIIAFALFALFGCGDRDSPTPGARPTLRADSGGSSVLMIIACPPSAERALAVGELIQLVANHAELIVARNGGSARLVINGCPFPPLPVPPIPPQRQR
jgi:hypothetical protein